jgi:hypothetical protein
MDKNSDDKQQECRTCGGSGFAPKPVEEPLPHNTCPACGEICRTCQPAINEANKERARQFKICPSCQGWGRASTPAERAQLHEDLRRLEQERMARGG